MSLSPQELTRCNQQLHGRGSVLTGAMATVFYSVYDPRQCAQMPWREAGVQGALCLVSDKQSGAYAFMIFALHNFSVLYSFELYPGMDYRELHTSFHAYETSDGLLGFSFVDERAAHRFFTMVQEILNDTGHIYDATFFNPDGTLKLENLPSSWLHLLTQAGFTDADLQDPSLSDLILSCLEDMGISTQAPPRDLAPADLQKAGASPAEIEQYQRYQADLEAYEASVREEVKEQQRQQRSSARAPARAPAPAPAPSPAAPAPVPRREPLTKRKSLAARLSRRKPTNAVEMPDFMRPTPVATANEALGLRPSARQAAPPDVSFRPASKRASLSQRLRRSLSRQNSSATMASGMSTLTEQSGPSLPPRVPPRVPPRKAARAPAAPASDDSYNETFDDDDSDDDNGRGGRSPAGEYDSSSRERLLRAGPSRKFEPSQHQPPAPPAMPNTLTAGSGVPRPAAPRLSLLQQSKRGLTAPAPRPNFTVQRIRQSVLPDLTQVKLLQQETLVDRLRQGLMERRERIRSDSFDSDDWS
ncbi:Neural Wiskott-Aldrich syndrome protein [Hondaea fermentalgiana]|uniref:Neural Wiskott-Aldrich syndrome protein n=1 Tax=Hondaea fermentalgiana TaxID=2315210 RepID=A0A2R5GD34_9STRA|nr:Neural Wiskott-Aldrich syndrome protein [Hondaea fermentalgiana]|eukprot:GBG28847.1 Neural Wiskott-Aldrich syndrome protein [Hondaea fermentalgiana]